MSRSRPNRRTPKRTPFVSPAVVALSLVGLVVMSTAVVYSRAVGTVVSLSVKAGQAPPTSIDPSGSADDKTLTRTGQRAPDTLVECIPPNRHFDLGMQRRKVVVLNFFAT